mmetsp:Transcript_95376/g.269944  ORF Transcript_95376/g.269944 Transcript_95376/m.269944 type:complete len:311 (+) Transcript_95376:1278-2210(+)
MGVGMAVGMGVVMGVVMGVGMGVGMGRGTRRRRRGVGGMGVGRKPRGRGGGKGRGRRGRDGAGRAERPAKAHREHAASHGRSEPICQHTDHPLLLGAPLEAPQRGLVGEPVVEVLVVLGLLRVVGGGVRRRGPRGEGEVDREDLAALEVPGHGGDVAAQVQLLAVDVRLLRHRPERRLERRLGGRRGEPRDAAALPGALQGADQDALPAADEQRPVAPRGGADVVRVLQPDVLLVPGLAPLPGRHAARQHVGLAVHRHRAAPDLHHRALGRHPRLEAGGHEDVHDAVDIAADHLDEPLGHLHRARHHLQN